MYSQLIYFAVQFIVGITTFSEFKVFLLVFFPLIFLVIFHNDSLITHQCD